MKSYGVVRLLAGVNLRVERGTVFALLGPRISLAGQYPTVDELQTGEACA